MKNWKIIIAGLVLISLAGLAVGVVLIKGGKLGSRINQAEKTVFSTSTNANYEGVPVYNVNEFQFIGYTIVGQTASGTVRFACSMQDDIFTNAATSTTNRWDYVDATDIQTETSLDGWTGVVLTGETSIKHYVIRNSVFRWCTARISGNTTPSGYGTTTVYLKQVEAP